MISLFIALLAIFVIWKISEAVTQSPIKNFSKTSVPLIKNSFNLVGYSPEKMFVFIRSCAAEFKVSYRHKFFRKLNYNVIRAKDAEKLLSSSKHIDKGFIYNLLTPFLKTGLLTSKREKWHSRRRMLTPTFHFDILKEFFEVFKEESDRLVDILKLQTGKVVDIVPISSQFTLSTICESAMGVKLSELGNDGVNYRNKIYEIGTLLLFRLTRPWFLIDSLYSLLGHKKKLDDVLKPAHDFTRSIINRRKLDFKANSESREEKDSEEVSENVYFRSKKRRYAMMDTLLQAQQNGLIDDEGIMEETDTFTFEGHDTTSAAMTFTLLLLAHNPDAQEKLLEEIKKVLTENDKDELTIDDFNKMEYLDRLVKESMRIYPPVPFISREFSEDFSNDGVTHPKGTTFHIHIFDIHRDPEVYPDPEKFDPDRFLPENSAKRSNFSYIAFSAGMRNCIGQRFALLEIKLMLTKVLTKFKVLPVTTREEIVFITDLVLRSKNPIEIIFETRE